jgi:vitamin B12 transporter
MDQLSYLRQAAGCVLLAWCCALAMTADAQAATSPELEQPIEELIVSASRMPTRAREVGRVVTVMEEAEISNLGYEYAADLFRFIPGVAVNRTGGYGGQAQVRIRGAEANHSVILIDGVDVSSAGSGEFDISSLLSADIERIEVLRGPQSGLYGSNALGGVVNIRTRTPLPGLSLGVDLEAGENATRHGAISLSGGSERLRGRLGVIQRTSEFDLSTDDSLMGGEDDEDDNRTVSGQLLYDATDQLSFRLIGRYSDKETQVDGFDFSGGPQQGLPVDNDTVSNTQDYSVGLVSTLRLADGRSTTQLAMTRTDTEIDGGSFGSEAQRQEVRLDSSWAWNEQESLAQRTTLFLQWEEESFRNTVTFDPSQVPTQKRDLLGYGIEHRIGLFDRVFINASLRRDHNEDFANTTTYAVDVSYLLDRTGTRLHASYGKAVTNPTFFEQFGFVPGSFQGNPGLQPEASRGWDVGIEQTLLDATLLIDLSYFNADLSDEIQPLFPSVVNVDGDSDRKGMELSVHWQPGVYTSVIGSYSYTDATEPGGPEVRRPRHMASLSVAHNLLDGRLRLSAAAYYNGEMLDTDFRRFFTNGFVAERTELDDYTLVNFGAALQVTRAFEVYLRAENLLDASYAESIGYAAPGRAWFAGLRFRIGG